MLQLWTVMSLKVSTRLNKQKTKTILNLKKGHYLIFLCLVLFSNCSTYVNYLEEEQNKNYELIAPAPKANFCPNQQQNLNLIHNEEFTFQEFPFQGPNDTNLYNAAELGTFLTLYQMLVRPDATDWSSRVQIHIKVGAKDYHREFGPFEELPLLAALNDLKKNRFLPFHLQFYINKINQKAPKKIHVQEKFQNFLQENSSKLISQKNIRDNFFKLDIPLQKGETYKRVKLSLPKSKQKISSTPPPLFSIDSDSPDFRCSFDANLYKKGIFLISKAPEYENTFGLTTKNGDYFFMITKKTSSPKKAYKGQLITGKKAPSLSPFCHFFETTKSPQKKNFTLMGQASRDPGQLLYHLYNYQIYDSKSPLEAEGFLKFPRHQFLVNPSRLIYESEKGSEDQLRYFLSLDFPVYHTDKLGQVHIIWEQPNQTTFINDNRSDIVQSCLSK